MEDLGLKTAIMVSSPYHMRRIKIITARVMAKWPGNDHFVGGDSGEGHAIGPFAFVPAPANKPPGKIWFLHQEQLKDVLQECAKIFWFVIYS
jgi:hypothetical protein